MSDSLRIGGTIRDRYEVQALIGQGGMGAVYRVADSRLPGRLCALKVVRMPYASADPNKAARQQFLLEASTLARLDHPNLPKVSDYFALRDYDCLVMDYVPGQDLLQRVQDARRHDQFLPLHDVLNWTDQLCDVLEYLHGQQPPIIHGDIKPANIKLTGEGRVKLVDFGLVRPGDPAETQTVTGAGLRGLGSLAYAALEQYAGSSAGLGPRADLYSAGATLYHLATNQPPAGAHDRFLDPQALVPPEQLNPTLPAWLSQAILMAMAPHPKDRPASAAEWRLMLAHSQTAEPEAEPPSDWRAAWAENRWYAVTGLALLAVAIVLTLLR